MHNIWWIVIVVVCVGAAACIMFALAMEYWSPKPPEPPYRLDLDEFYRNDHDNRRE